MGGGGAGGGGRRGGGRRGGGGGRNVAVMEIGTNRNNTRKLILSKMGSGIRGALTYIE